MYENIDQLKKKLELVPPYIQEEILKDAKFTCSNKVENKVINISEEKLEKLLDILSIIVRFGSMNPDVNCINMLNTFDKEPIINLNIYAANNKIKDNSSKLIYDTCGIKLCISYENVFVPDLYLGQILYDKNGRFTKLKKNLVNNADFNWNYDNLIAFNPPINIEKIKIIKGEK